MHCCQRKQDRFRAQLRWLEEGLNMLIRTAWSMITGWRSELRRDRSHSPRDRGPHGTV